MTLAGRYHGRSVDRLVGELAPFGVSDGRRWRLDLRRLLFMTPTAIATAAATFERVALRGDEVDIDLPEDPDCRTYVQRIDLLPQQWRRPEAFDRRDAIRFCPTRRFVGAGDYAGVRGDVVDTIRRACTIDDTAAGALATCLDELFENVVHHSRSDAPAVAVAQAWPKRRLLEIAIADSGRGIPASLRSSDAYAELSGEDVGAVEAAFRFGVTSNPDFNAGMGLALARHLVRGNGGTVGIRSGFAAVTRGRAEVAQGRGVRFPGTLVALDVRMDRPFDLSRAYADMDEERGSNEA